MIKTSNSRNNGAAATQAKSAASMRKKKSQILLTDNDNGESLGISTAVTQQTKAVTHTTPSNSSSQSTSLSGTVTGIPPRPPLSYPTTDVVRRSSNEGKATAMARTPSSASDTASDNYHFQKQQRQRPEVIVSTELPRWPSRLPRRRRSDGHGVFLPRRRSNAKTDFTVGQSEKDDKKYNIETSTIAVGNENSTVVTSTGFEQVLVLERRSSGAVVDGDDVPSGPVENQEHQSWKNQEGQRMTSTSLTTGKKNGSNSETNKRKKKSTRRQVQRLPMSRSNNSSEPQRIMPHQQHKNSAVRSNPMRPSEAVLYAPGRCSNRNKNDNTSSRISNRRNSTRQVGLQHIRTAPPRTIITGSGTDNGIVRTRKQRKQQQRKSLSPMDSPTGIKTLLDDHLDGYEDSDDDVFEERDENDEGQEVRGVGPSAALLERYFRSYTHGTNGTELLFHWSDDTDDHSRRGSFGRNLFDKLSDDDGNRLDTTGATSDGHCVADDHYSFQSPPEMARNVTSAHGWDACWLVDLMSDAFNCHHPSRCSVAS